MLVHTAYHRSSKSPAKILLFSCPSLDWRFDYFLLPATQPTKLFNPRDPSSRLITLHNHAVHCAPYFLQYTQEQYLSTFTLNLFILFYFIFYCLLFAYGWSRRQKNSADCAAQDGQAPSISFISPNVYTSEAFTSWTTY
jgi:hypothetical protein